MVPGADIGSRKASASALEASADSFSTSSNLSETGRYTFLLWS
jgi:hypothetical protein